MIHKDGIAKTVARALHEEGDDLDQMITVGGERIVVRKFRDREKVIAAAIAGPLLHGMLDHAMQSGKITPGNLRALIAEHVQDWRKLVSMSCGKEPDWIAALPDAHRGLLFFAFWQANSAFLVQRMVKDEITRKLSELSPDVASAAVVSQIAARLGCSPCQRECNRADRTEPAARAELIEQDDG